MHECKGGDHKVDIKFKVHYCDHCLNEMMASMQRIKECDTGMYNPGYEQPPKFLTRL